MGPLVERFGERIIIDSGFGRYVSMSCNINSQEWRWPLTRSPGWIELARCTLVSYKRCDIVWWKDVPTSIFSIYYAWNAFRHVLSKMEWWILVKHKHVVPLFSFILWLAIWEALSTQDKLMSYGLIQTNKCLLCGGGGEDVDHLFWYDLCSKCLIPYNHLPWVSTIVWLSILGRGNSLQSLVIRLTSTTAVYDI